MHTSLLAVLAGSWQATAQLASSARIQDLASTGGIVGVVGLIGKLWGRADRRRDMRDIQRQMADHAKHDEMVIQRIVERFEERDETGRAAILQHQEEIQKLALEIRELSVRISNGLHSDVKDIKDRLQNLERDQLSQARLHGPFNRESA